MEPSAQYLKFAEKCDAAEVVADLATVAEKQARPKTFEERMAARDREVEEQKEDHDDPYSM